MVSASCSSGSGHTAYRTR